MNLDQLRPGDTAVIERLSCPADGRALDGGIGNGRGPDGRSAEGRLPAGDALGQRLHELGFIGGTRLRVVRQAPFGGPMQVEVGTQRIALRRTEAARVVVRSAPGVA